MDTFLWSLRHAQKGLYVRFRPALNGRQLERSLTSMSVTELRALRWRADEELRARRRQESRAV